MKKVKFLGWNVRVPNHPVLRIVMGIVLCLGGFLGFLPILGFWMLPLGLVILSIDFSIVRRLRRWATVKLGIWFQRRYPQYASKIGLNGLRGTRA